MKKGLLFLVLSVLTIGAWAQTSPYTGVAVNDIESGKDYYLYNVESGLWLQNNDRTTNDWHTRGQLGTRGIDLQLNADGAGYKINAKFGRSSINHENLYLDANDNDVWVFKSVTVGSVSNAVTISCSGTVLGAREYVRTYKAKNLFTEETESNYYLENQANEGTKNNTWQIVTKAERLEKMAAATESSPMDASWLVKSSDFANNDSRYSSWKLTGSWARGGDVNGDWGRGSMIMESWNSGNNVQISQVINDVPNGKYELQLQGYYRDGMAGDNTDFNERGCTNETCIEARHDARTEVIRAKYFANATEADLRSIIDETHTSAKTGPDCWNFTRLERYYFPNDMQTAQRAMNIEKAYVNDPIQVIVTDGILTIGVKKTGSVAYDWVILDNFKLTYLGPVVDLGPYLETLNNNIDAAEAYNGDTTDALASALASALATAKAARSSEDTDELSQAAHDLHSALEAAEAADVSVLRPSVAYAKARGVDVSAQEDYLVNGISTDVASQLNAVIISVKQHYAETSSQPTIFTMVSESVVGTDDNNYGTIVDNHADGFYVYNVGTGRWFCGGDEHCTHAAVGFPGIKVTTPKNDYESGHYNSVITWLCNGNWGTYWQMAHNGYCDTQGESAAWKFWKQNADEGIYTWSRNGSNTGDNSGNGYGTKNLVGFAPSTYARVNTDRTDANDPYNQWIFVTEAQRDQMAAAAMATASESNPVDLTYKIKMPGFNQRERKEGTNQSSEELDWTCNRANYCYNASDNSSRKIIMGRGDNHADFVCDVYGYTWHEFGNGDDSFSWTQTVTGLTPGKYRVKVQGYNNGGETANKACLVANGQSAALVERSSESVLPWTSGLPENTFDNPEYFQVGCYWNSVICTVGSNGELTLGVESPSITGGHVVIFDNFRLEYVGLSGVTVGDANYTTFVAPYHIDTMPEGVEAYACQVNTNSVHLEQVDAIPEGEAVVLKNTGTYKFSPSASAVELGTTNDLKASDGSVTGAAGNIYALASKTNGVGFYPVGSSVTVPAGKGYLQIASEVKPFYGFDEDDATGISLMEDGRSQMEDGAIYNVAGQRLSKTQKGINIVNGKKIAVK